MIQWMPFKIRNMFSPLSQHTANTLYHASPSPPTSSGFPKPEPMHSVCTCGMCVSVTSAHMTTASPPPPPPPWPFTAAIAASAKCMRVCMWCGMVECVCVCVPSSVQCWYAVSHTHTHAHTHVLTHSYNIRDRSSVCKAHTTTGLPQHICGIPHTPLSHARRARNHPRTLKHTHTLCVVHNVLWACEHAHRHTSLRNRCTCEYNWARHCMSFRPNLWRKHIKLGTLKCVPEREQRLKGGGADLGINAGQKHTSSIPENPILPVPSVFVPLWNQMIYDRHYIPAQPRLF